jgi:hypothetical protein
VRLLLSVPSTSTFLASLSLIEPASVDLCVLESGRRKRGGAVRAILRADEQAERGGRGLRLGEGFREWVAEEEGRYAAGPLALLKAIKVGGRWRWQCVMRVWRVGRGGAG